MKKHYIDLQDNYLGDFIDGALPSVEAIEVPERPSENHVYSGVSWEYDEATHWQNIRNKRDTLLADTDLQAALPDHPRRDDILQYRQALRDIPQTYDKPDDVVWPINPLEGDSE